MLKGLIRLGTKAIRTSKAVMNNRVFSSVLSHYSFCTSQAHPILILVQDGFHHSRTEAILQQIENLTSNDKERVLKTIIFGVEKGKIPFQTLVNEKFLNLVIHYPWLYLDARLYFADVMLIPLNDCMIKDEEGSKQTIKIYLSMISKAYADCLDLLGQMFLSFEVLGYRIKVMRKIKSFWSRYESKYKSIQSKQQQFNTFGKQYQTFKPLLLQCVRNQKQQIDLKSEDADLRKMMVLLYLQFLSELVMYLDQMSINLIGKGGEGERWQEICQNRRQIKKQFEEIIKLFSSFKGITATSISYFELRLRTVQLGFELGLLELVDNTHQQAFEEKVANPYFEELKVLYEQLLQAFSSISGNQELKQEVVSLASLIMDLQFNFLCKQQVSLQDFEKKLLEQKEVILKSVNSMSLYMIVGERLDHLIKERMHKETKKRHGSEGTNE